MLANVVYVLCALTSVACALLLVRGYLRSRTRLLLWSSLGFVGLAFNNAMLVFDRIIFPAVPMGHLPTLPAVVGMCVMTLGLILDEG
jgi:hypothetical protein